LQEEKKKTLVPSPNLYFMDVKCPVGYKITTDFSQVQTVLLCAKRSTVHVSLLQEKPG
jgi:small subunit ribosomal protein S27e